MNKPADLSKRQHGTASTYNAGCRCRPCTDAKSRYVVERRAEKAGTPLPSLYKAMATGRPKIKVGTVTRRVVTAGANEEPILTTLRLLTIDVGPGDIVEVVHGKDEMVIRKSKRS